MISMEPLTILVVEDDRADRKLIQRSIIDQKIANDLEVVSSGEEGLDYLNECIAHPDKKILPDLILLDLNMPGMGGKNFLNHIKKSDDFKHIPVVILTVADAEKDILDTYKLQAAGYINKPVTLNEFQTIMKQIEAYWFVLCKRPSRHAVTEYI